MTNWIHKLSLPIIGLILLLCASNIQWGKDYWQNIIVSDGKGYYSYLPAVFIYQDLNFTFADSIEEKYFNENTVYEYRITIDGNRINKYYAGTAVAMAPFFLVAHGLSHLLGYSPDGFSKLYALSCNFAAIFYLLLGLFFARRLLRLLQIKEWLNTLLIFAFAFGTNLFYYALIEPCMSHVYSFAFISILVYLLTKYFQAPDSKTLFIAALVLGMILLIRPINSLVLLSIPFLAGSWEQLKKGIHIKQVLLSALLCVAVFSIQLIIYKIQTGHFVVDSYTMEHFNWSDPHLLDILFSYKKGLFLYTPLCFIALLGFVHFFRKNRFQFFSLLSFFLILTYVLSSWWNWWYGGSFSSRVFSDYLIFFILLFAYAFKVMETKIYRSILIGSLVLFTFFSQFQTYQYRYYLIHWEDMTKEKYWDSFLKLP